MNLGQPPDHPASPDEISSAIEALSDSDQIRLSKAARLCLFGSDYTDADDLISEAIVRTMNGSVDGAGHIRIWKVKVPFIAYMIQTMKGLANDSRNTLQQSKTANLEAMAPVGASTEDLLGAIGHSHIDPLTEALEAEDALKRQKFAVEQVAKLEAQFSSDTEVGYIILGHKEEMSAKEVQDLAGMTQAQYATARRRFRRGIDKLFSEKRER